MDKVAQLFGLFCLTCAAQCSISIWRETTESPYPTFYKPDPCPQPSPYPYPAPDPYPSPTTQGFDYADDGTSPGNYPGGNMQLQLTRRGLDSILYYLRLFAEDPWTKLFDIPAADQDDQSFTNVRFSRGLMSPKIEGKFNSAGAVEFSITLPTVQASGNYKSKTGVRGAFTSDMKDLSTVVQAAVRLSDKKTASLYIKGCTTSPPTFTTFGAGVLAGAELDEMRSFGQTYLTNGYRDFICHGAKYLVVVLNTVFFDLENAIYPQVPTYDGAPTPEINMSMVCGADKVSSPPTKAESLLRRITDEVSGTAFDWTMNSDEAFFTAKEMIVGIRGDFRLRNRGSKLQLPLAKPVWLTDRSICWTINDTLVNSFALHAFKENFFNTTVNLVYDIDLPVEIRTQLAAFCPGSCQLYANVFADAPPVADFRKTLPKVLAKMRMVIYARSGDRVERVMDAQLDIDLAAVVSYEADYIKSYLLLSGLPKYQLHTIFLPNLLDQQIYLFDMLTRVYTYRLWPLIDAKYKKLMMAPGVIKLPVYCGFNFYDHFVQYSDGLVYFCANFNFYYDGFMARYRPYWRKMMGYAT